MTFPPVPVPRGGGVRVPLEIKLKRDWQFNTRRRVFESDAGAAFVPGGLPKGTRIVYKTPNLARAPAATLNEHERELRRYMQIILPPGESPTTYLGAVRAWPPVEEAHPGPEVSLP
ncbi:MAG: hypothetical protein ACRENP_04165 [Longimicrobiales bacterium]